MGTDYSVGAEFISDTNEHTGRFNCIYFKEDSVINAITAQDYTGNSLAGETFVARTKIFGVFTSVTLTSGAAVAYKI
jgi:hypothetical protein|tara:strand:- start:518 stop:748 length:231 start_codon:yes stop_codon:yes gene_type:complete